MQTRDTERIVRETLFGLKMKLFPGGWSYLDQKKLRDVPNSPVNASSPEEAVELGVAFMRNAQKQWEQAGQSSQLFPVGNHFKLVKRKAVQITVGKRKVCWRVEWNILGQPGKDSKYIPTVAKDFLFIENAIIVLYIAQTGNIIGGNAHWRPTAKPRSVIQNLLPDQFLEHVNAARSKGHADDEHGHEAESEKSSTKGQATMHYSVGTRTEFRNFVDPYIRFSERAPHSHEPNLVVPVTKYGVHAEILTRARRVGTISSGTAEVEVIPWVNMHDGSKSPRADRRIKGHWTVLSLGDEPKKRPRKVPLSGPLRLKGLYEVTLTVQTAQGGIAHAHSDVCSALAPKTVFDPSRPVS